MKFTKVSTVALVAILCFTSSITMAGPIDRPAHFILSKRAPTIGTQIQTQILQDPNFFLKLNQYHFLRQVESLSPLQAQKLKQSANHFDRIRGQAFDMFESMPLDRWENSWKAKYEKIYVESTKDPKTWSSLMSTIVDNDSPKVLTQAKAFFDEIENEPIRQSFYRSLGEIYEKAQKRVSLPQTNAEMKLKVRGHVIIRS
jgi:hypothetical protein